MEESSNLLKDAQYKRLTQDGQQIAKLKGLGNSSKDSDARKTEKTKSDSAMKDKESTDKK